MGDRYLSPALEILSSKLLGTVRTEVLDATVIAGANSAPRLLAVALCIVAGDGSPLGFGAVVGSVAINILLVPAIVTVLTAWNSVPAPSMMWWPMLRDGSALGWALLLLTGFTLVAPAATGLRWWHALILVVSHISYVGIMSRNEELYAFAKSHLALHRREALVLVGAASDANAAGEASDDDGDAVAAQPAKNNLRIALLRMQLRKG